MVDLDDLLKSKKLAYATLIAAPVFGIGMFLYLSISADNARKRFQQNTIYGAIGHIELEHHDIIFTISHHPDEKYRFIRDEDTPLLIEPGKSIWLGDSIYKPAHADFVIITKNGIKTRYPVYKQ